MAGDMFLKVDGAPGESTDEKHDGWIEIDSWSYGYTQNVASGGRSTGGARTAEQVNISDVTIMKGMDKASPELFFLCCNGKHIPNVVIEVCRASEKKEKYWEIKLTDVLITSCQPSQGVGDIPRESVTFNPGKIEWIYTEMSHGPGKPGGPITHNWSLLKNVGG